MSEWTFVWAAYGISWAVLCGYLVYGVTRLRRAERRQTEVDSRTGGES